MRKHTSLSLAVNPIKVFYFFHGIANIMRPYTDSVRLFHSSSEHKLRYF